MFLISENNIVLIVIGSFDTLSEEGVTLMKRFFMFMALNFFLTIFLMRAVHLKRYVFFFFELHSATKLQCDDNDLISSEIVKFTGIISNHFSFKSSAQIGVGVREVFKINIQETFHGTTHIIDDRFKKKQFYYFLENISILTQKKKI